MEIGDKVKFVKYVADTPEEEKEFSRGEILELTAFDTESKSFEAVNKDGLVSLVYPQEVKKIDTTKLDPLYESLENLTDDEVLNEFYEVANSIAKNFIRSGRVLCEMQRRKLYEREEFAGRYLGSSDKAFAEFMKWELNYSADEGYNCMKIYNNSRGAQITSEDLLGITSHRKLFEASRVINNKNKEELLGMCKTGTMAEIKEYVNNILNPEALGMEEEEEEEYQTPKSIPLQFDLEPKDYTKVLDVLETICELQDYGGNYNQAFLFMLGEFNSNSELSCNSLEYEIEHLNEKYGTNLSLQDALASKEAIKEY
ncbi:hypothetical protein [Cognatishimia sp.]|uniref:hypothetical protein n=1 Tax=Cognatishimia sp. TaxID=2211648 RepID=UPI00351426A0|nr:hypothetical protein [Cognatishimia sp.]